MVFKTSDTMLIEENVYSIVFDWLLYSFTGNPLGTGAIGGNVHSALAVYHAVISSRGTTRNQLRTKEILSRYSCFLNPHCFKVYWYGNPVSFIPLLTRAYSV